MQTRHPVTTLRQTRPRQQMPGLVNDLDIVMILGPVIPTNNTSSPPVLADGSVEETPSDLMAKCSPQTSGHVIPSAVASPHDQPAHGLPQDLNGQMSRVLTRQPLPTPSLPNPPGKSH
jgi:hypothetical protein